MIAALLNTEDANSEIVLFILEPANVEKLQLGSPIVKCLNDFFPDLPKRIEVSIAYTPDVVWVGEQLRAGKDLAQTLFASIARLPVYMRTLDPEALVQCEITPARETT